jgi:hypothetical protein
MSGIVPTQGRFVMYTLASWDVTEIHKKRGLTGRANEVEPGMTFPAIIVKTWGSTPQSACNLKVLLDGDDIYWATSRCVEPVCTNDGEPLHTDGCFYWMDYQRGQAAKSDAMVAEVLERIRQIEARVDAMLTSPGEPPADARD